MKLIDADIFFDDLRSEGHDVLNLDHIDPSYSEFGYSSELIRKVIEKQKTIEAKPVIHAYWKRFCDRNVFWYACSNCEREVPRDQYGHDYFSLRCPCCGAHMEVEEEGTDE